MGKDDPPPPTLLEPGPHELPLRWILYTKSCKTLKIGTSTEEPMHYIERHSFWRRRPWQVLHASAHKKDKAPALVATYKPKKSWFFRPRDFLIKFPTPGANGLQHHDIEMKMSDRGLLLNTLDANSYEFAMPTATGYTETFHWRKRDWGSHCEEVRAIRKADEPPVHAGDPRPPQQEGFHFSKPYSGWILVRVNGPGRKAPGGGEGQQLPMGYTENGDEIVASYAEASGWTSTCTIIFQFWGAGATGELGEDWTRVAALTGSTIWDDEARKRQRRQAEANRRNNGH
ncbi:hypothetical protein V8F06_010165 [Rhypophila decipiens]